jgi:hypothetical protein
MATKQKTLKEYLQTTIQGNYQDREKTRRSMLENFRIMNLQSKTDNPLIRQLITNYYQELGLNPAQGPFDLNFESDKRGVGITFTFEPNMLYGMITVNDTTKYLLARKMYSENKSEEEKR